MINLWTEWLRSNKKKIMKQYLELLDRVLGNSKTLSKIEFEKEYKGNPIQIILSAPLIFNDSICLYRGRLADDVGKKEDLSSPATFSYVPLVLNKNGLPKMGRANYKGQSIFYASEQMKTNFKEISKDSNIGDEAYMAKWKLKPNSNLRLYRTIPAWGIETDNKPDSIFTITEPNIVDSELGVYLKRLGYIMMSNEEIGKYLGSSYIANCIYSANGYATDSAGNKYEVYYDGIVYPSVAAGETEEVNIALKPQFVDKNLELECVIKGRLAPDMRSVIYEKIGINENGKIIWYTSFINEESITNIVTHYCDSNGNYIDVSKGKIFDADNNVVSSEIPFVHAFKFHRDEVFNVLAQFVHTEVKESQTITKTSLEKSVNLCFIREFNGWKLFSGGKSIPLSKVMYSFTLKNQLREITREDL